MVHKWNWSTYINNTFTRLIGPTEDFPKLRDCALEPTYKYHHTKLQMKHLRIININTYTWPICNKHLKYSSLQTKVYKSMLVESESPNGVQIKRLLRLRMIQNLWRRRRTTLHEIRIQIALKSRKPSRKKRVITTCCLPSLLVIVSKLQCLEKQGIHWKIRTQQTCRPRKRWKCTACFPHCSPVVVRSVSWWHVWEVCDCV